MRWVRRQVTFQWKLPTGNLEIWFPTLNGTQDNNPLNYQTINQSDNQPSDLPTYLPAKQSNAHQTYPPTDYQPTNRLTGGASHFPLVGSQSWEWNHSQVDCVQVQVGSLYRHAFQLIEGWIDLPTDYHPFYRSTYLLTDYKQTKFTMNQPTS